MKKLSILISLLIISELTMGMNNPQRSCIKAAAEYINQDVISINSSNDPLDRFQTLSKQESISLYNAFEHKSIIDEIETTLIILSKTIDHDESQRAIHHQLSLVKEKAIKISLIKKEFKSDEEINRLIANLNKLIHDDINNLYKMINNLTDTPTKCPGDDSKNEMNSVSRQNDPTTNLMNDTARTKSAPIFTPAGMMTASVILAVVSCLCYFWYKKSNKKINEQNNNESEENTQE